jgi:hypothetical protein
MVISLFRVPAEKVTELGGHTKKTNDHQCSVMPFFHNRRDYNATDLITTIAVLII